MRPTRLPTELLAVFLVSALLAFIRVVEDDHNERGLDRQFGPHSDETEFYVPAITQIYHRWPKVDLLADSLSATPPGYAFLVATEAKVVGLDLRRLRLLHLLASAAIPVLLFGWLRRRWSVAAAAAILSPLVLSSYFIKSSAYLVPDNPALLTATIALLLLLESSRSAAPLSMLVVVNAGATFIRQTALWYAAPTAIVWLLLSRRREHPNALAARWATRAQFVALGAAILIPLVLVARFYFAWGGLVPLADREMATGGLGLTPVVYILSMVAIFWWPYLIASNGLRACARFATHRSALLSAAAGLSFALIANTAYDMPAGHWGGYLWKLASLLPEVGQRSILFAVLAPLGALALAVAFRRLADDSARSAVVLGVGLAAWATTCAANQYVFHRYYEPYVLMFLIAVAALSDSKKLRPYSLRNFAPLLAVSAAQLAVTVATVYLPLFPNLRG